MEENSMSKKGKIVLGVAGTFVVLAAIGSQMPDTQKANTTALASAAAATSDYVAPVEASDSTPDETSGQANARRTASDYIDSSGFSRTGLIKQLKFEGYSLADATYGADAIGADWNEQAARTAADYLDSSGFSRSGLIEQLEFEGYTASQASYGASQALGHRDPPRHLRDVHRDRRDHGNRARSQRQCRRGEAAVDDDHPDRVGRRRDHGRHEGGSHVGQRNLRRVAGRRSSGFEQAGRDGLG